MQTATSMISHGSIFQSRFGKEPRIALVEESAKDITKLHYRGKYDDFPAWHIGIMKAMRKLNISRVIATDKPTIEIVRSRNPDKNPSEHADILWDMQREHGVQLTELYYLRLE